MTWEVLDEPLPEYIEPGIRYGNRGGGGYQCYCGRWAKYLGGRSYYNGTWDCYSYDVMCSRCGQVTVECV